MSILCKEFLNAGETVRRSIRYGWGSDRGRESGETIVNFQKVVSKCLDKPWAHIDFF